MVFYYFLTLAPIIMKFTYIVFYKPIPVAARSRVSVCGPSLGRILGSDPTRGMDVCLV